MNKTVFIILVNYNRAPLTMACVDSLKKMGNQNYKVIIVDNCSTDNSFELLTIEYTANEKVIVIKNIDNTGFAGGNNYGIEYALNMNAEYLMLLNNDTEVDCDFLDEILSNYHGDGIHVPRINYYDDKNSAWYAAGEIDYNKCVVRNGKVDFEQKVTFASGCCMLFSCQIIERIGLLKEEYFMYYEDVAYSLDAIQHNIDIIYKPNALVFHKVGKSSGGEKSKISIYYNNRNRFYIMKEYRFGLRCYLYTAITRIIRLMVGFVKKDNNIIILEAYLDYKKGVKGKKSF